MSLVDNGSLEIQGEALPQWKSKIVGGRMRTVVVDARAGVRHEAVTPAQRSAASTTKPRTSRSGLEPSSTWPPSGFAASLAQEAKRKLPSWGGSHIAARVAQEAREAFKAREAPRRTQSTGRGAGAEKRVEPEEEPKQPTTDTGQIQATDQPQSALPGKMQHNSLQRQTSEVAPRPVRPTSAPASSREVATMIATMAGVARERVPAQDCSHAALPRTAAQARFALEELRASLQAMRDPVRSPPSHRHQGPKISQAAQKGVNCPQWPPSDFAARIAKEARDKLPAWAGSHIAAVSIMKAREGARVTGRAQEAEFAVQGRALRRRFSAPPRSRRLQEEYNRDYADYGVDPWAVIKNGHYGPMKALPPGLQKLSLERNLCPKEDDAMSVTTTASAWTADSEASNSEVSTVDST